MARRRTIRSRNSRSPGRNVVQRAKSRRPPRRRRHARPAAAYRPRGQGAGDSTAFDAPEVWHEPASRSGIRYVVQPPGEGYVHAVTVDDIRRRIDDLPARFRQGIEVIQLSRMTRKRALFPCYGMQWGPNIYLYPIEESYVEAYVRTPHPAQVIEARMYGGKWQQQGDDWHLRWTAETIKDFYLNNVLIHEIAHVADDRNSNTDARERYAEWFAIEYGYRASRNRR